MSVGGDPKVNQGKEYIPDEKIRKVYERGKVSLPFSKALEIAFQSLKIRFWRSIITSSGVLLGIAFLVSVLTGQAITNALPATAEVMDEGQMIWIVAMSLLVCTVGITNAMLMSVTERFREIGTMKCLGALDHYIVKLFLLEAFFQGFVGSVAGAIIGLLSTLLINLARYGFSLVFSSFPVLLTLQYIVVSILLGSILSVFAGAYPAYRAAKLPPAEAMRTEV